ncbi:RNA polymerase subunit sigma, partial [Vibrio sp. 10N.261.48.A2]
MQVESRRTGNGKEHVIIPDNKLPTESKVPTELSSWL